MGINGSNFDNTNPVNSLSTSTNKNDAYLYIQGNLSNTSAPGGNLTIGTNTPGRTVKFIAGGGAADDVIATFSNTSLTTSVQIISTVATGTAPLVIASTTKVNNLYANRASYADRLNPGATINGTLFDGVTNIEIGANASLLTGTYLNSTVIGSSLTTVGNLVNLNVTGNVTANYVRTTSHGIFNANVYTNYIVASGRYLTELPSYAYSNVNVAAYLTASNISSQVNADWTSTTGVTKILNKTGTSGPTTIALGQNAAGNVQSSGAIAIGISAAGSTTTVQGADAIAIGTNAGGSLAKAQGDASIAIGKNAGGAGYGTDGQQQWSIAIGNDAGTSNQGGYSVAVGSYAGRYNQGNYTTALGHAAGLQSQGTGAVAIGAAGYESQGAYAVAIGSGAGDTMQGNNAIAIGYQAGGDHQTANSIILNASGSALETIGVAGLFIKPVRSVAATGNVVYYNASTSEITYAPAANLAIYAWSSNVTTANTIQSNQINAITADIANLQASSTGNIRYFGSFWDNTTVTQNANLAIINTVPIANTYGNLGVTIASGNRITFSANGSYKLDYSLQFHNTGNKTNQVAVWVRKNGSDIAQSASYFSLPAQGSVNGYICAVGPFIDGTITSGDYYQLMWVGLDSHISLQGIAAKTGSGTVPPVPLAPSTIVMVTRV
jgi:hypothetical protein